MSLDNLKKGGKKKEPPKEEPLNIISGKKLITERSWKILVDGFSGSGKSHFILSWVNYMVEIEEKHPDDVLLCIIDLDDGTAPLLEAGVVPEEYLGSIQYYLCKDYREYLRAYSHFKGVLKEHLDKTGEKGCLAIDNMGKLWEWARQQYCVDTYGMTMNQLLIQRRKEAMAAQKKVLPTFNQMYDYGVINPFHNSPLEQMKIISNQLFHYIWATPIKEFGGVISVTGQWENEFRVDYHLRKRTEGEGGAARFYADLLKSRGMSQNFIGLENPTFARFVAGVSKIKALDKKKRDALPKKALPKKNGAPTSVEEPKEEVEIVPTPIEDDGTSKKDPPKTKAEEKSKPEDGSEEEKPDAGGFAEW